MMRVDPLDSGNRLSRAREELTGRVGHRQVDNRRAAFRNDIGVGLKDLAILGFQQSRLHEGRVEPDLPLDELEPVIGHDEERRARGQTGRSTAATISATCASRSAIVVIAAGVRGP